MDDVENIKSKVDLVEVISSYLPLKKTGRNFAGLCPFHSEKTPSFMVSPERQAWKCFGCNESGDVFTFLEKIEGWEFKEALEELAKRAGVKLTSFKPSDSNKVRERLVDIHNLASKFYEHILNGHAAGEIARQYLTSRGIKKSTWERFSLGYAPSGWENLLNFLTKRSFVMSDIAQSGLVVGREAKVGSYYDRFRRRLMFPIRDSRGVTVGFAGRVLDEKLKEAKYVNSPQTAIFNKGSLLYGLDLAKEAIRKNNEAILVEGEFDVLSSYQVGVENVVASKGTALTEKQAALLSRICENVVLGFDADLAGDSAARRGIEILDLAGVNVKVVDLGDYKDPDDFCQKDRVGFRAAVKSAGNIYDYLIDSACGRYDVGTVEGKKKVGREIIPILGKITDDVVRAHFVGKLAKILELDANLVALAVEKKSSFEIFVKSSLSEGKLKPGKSLPQVGLEEYFLALFLIRDELEINLLLLLEVSDFEREPARKFWRWLHDIIKTSKIKNLKSLLKKLPKELGAFVDELFLINIGHWDDKELWADELVKIAKRIKRDSLRRQIIEISTKLREAEKVADERRIALLAKQFDELTKQLNQGG